jgi:hypothetical protein
MSYSVAAYYKRGEPIAASTDEEVDSLVDDLLAAGFENSIAKLHVRERALSAAGFPDHQLRVAVNAEDNVGSLHYMGPSFAGFSKGNVSKRDEVFYYYVDHDHEFPRDSEISIDLIRRAVKEFVASGGERPTCVEWQKESP